MAETQIQPVTKISRKKTFSGVVVSDKMKDTAVVLVSRYVQHQKYKKYVRSTKKYKAHDPGNLHKIGESVHIEETRPISKDKTFKII
jgi:small subunit ribosomal protein S17